MSRQECKVCLEIYNHEEHVPRFLTCGHSICTSCLGILLEDENLICPQCRTPYKGQVNSVNDVPVVYDLLLLPQESSRETILFDDIFRSLKKETTNTSSGKTLALEEQIKSLRAQLSDLNAQAEINDKVREKVIEHLDKNKEMVLNETDNVKEVIDIALAAKESMMNSQQAVKEATSLMDLFPAYEEAKMCYEISEISLQWNQMLLQRKVLENSRKTLSAYEAVRGRGDIQIEEPQAVPLLAQTSTSSWKKPKVFRGTVTIKLIKTGLRMGEVWAVTTWNENLRYAQLFDEEYHFFLHAFQDGKPPAGSLVVEYESLLQFQYEEYKRRWNHLQQRSRSNLSNVYRPLNYYSTPKPKNLCKIFFLELSWGTERRGKTKRRGKTERKGKTERRGRVLIRTEGTDERTQLFQHLCLGDKGPSYVNTRMESKGIDGLGWVYVTGGEGRSKYERKDLFSNVNSGVDSPNVEHFDRCEWNVEMSIDDDCPGTFSIYTTCTSSDQPSSNNFVGKVCDGVILVKKILELPNIKDVKITDCGTRIPEF